MLIRSKNKMHCANSENGIISTNEKGTIGFYDNSGTYVVLGEYSNPNKVIKVLNMFQEAHDAYERCKSVGGFRDIKTFQMPKDSEVEE